MVVKRGAALAAGLVVVAGLVGGCAQKPGVAATATPVSCGKTAEALPPVFSVGADGTVSWSCGDSPVVRGETVTISTAEVADVIALTETSEGVAVLADLYGVPNMTLTSSEAISTLVPMRILLQVAEEHGVKVSDDEVADWLDQSGVEASNGARVIARVFLLDIAMYTLPEEQIQALVDDFSATLEGLDVRVNPRFGTFDPEQFSIVPPTWAPTETFLTGF